MTPQNELLATESLKEAMTHLGIKEATGHNDGPFVEMIQMWYAGKAELGAPWCACFASYCIAQAATRLGIPTILRKSDSSTEIYHNAQSKGLSLDSPIPGCIGLLKGNGGTSGKDHHHTFRVISVDLAAGNVNCIDGNWTNAVALTVHRIKDCDFVAVA